MIFFTEIAVLIAFRLSLNQDVLNIYVITYLLEGDYYECSRSLYKDY
jgi:hypothetical protein